MNVFAQSFACLMIQEVITVHYKLIFEDFLATSMLVMFCGLVCLPYTLPAGQFGSPVQFLVDTEYSSQKGSHPRLVMLPLIQLVGLCCCAPLSV